MKTTNVKTKLIVAVLILTVTISATAQITSFSYQGRLSENGVLANGFYDFTFAVYDNATNQLGNAIQINSVSVNSGLFAVSLDFGSGVFNGAPRWLLIGVRTNGSQSPHTFLSPMQKIESTPYAIYANSAENLAGNIADSKLSSNIPRLNEPINFQSEVTFGLTVGAPFYVSNSVRIPNLNADLIDGLDSTAFSRTSHVHSAEQITSGTLADARLSANVAFSDRNNAFSGNNTFPGMVIATNPMNIFYGSFTGNGYGITNLNANYLVGSIQSSNLAPNIARLNSAANFTGNVSFTPSNGAPFTVGSSIKITNLNADFLDGLDSSEFSKTNHLQPADTIIGTLPDQNLSTNVALLNRGQSFNGSNIFSGVVVATNSNNTFVGNGFGLQNINATNVVGVLSIMTIPTNVARLNTLANFSAPVVFNPSYGAPFSVSNSIKVMNLNADLLDGLDSAAFASAAHNHNAGDIASGTLLDSRLSSNVAMLSRNQQFTGNNLFSGTVTITNPLSVISGNGYGITNLQATNIIGILGLQNIPSGFARLSSNQTFTGIVGFTPTSGGAPFTVGNTNVVTNLNADLLDGLSATNFWKIGGNSGAGNPSILGNTDNFPLEFRVNNVRALRIEPKSLAPNIVGGNSANSSGSGEGMFIGGGYLNSVTGNYAVVSGGYNNVSTAAGAVVGGGDRNQATNMSATVPGGAFNIAGGIYSFAAGYSARALHSGTFVWSDSSSGSDFTSSAANQFLIRAAGGVGIGVTNPLAALHISGNVIAANIQASTLRLTNAPTAGGFLTCDVSGNAAWSASPWRSFSISGIPNIIGGHGSNFINSAVYGSVISGGGGSTESNTISVNYGTIGGGSANRVNGEYGVISGGKSNLLSALYGTISGGINNYTRDNGGAVGGGAYNNAVGYYTTVSGGYNNSASNNYAVVSGGAGNQSLAAYSFIAGGYGNKAYGSYSAISGGYNNQSSNSYTSVGGGYYNQATNTYATVPGGRENTAGGSYSFAAGYRAQAIHSGSFVWSDSSSSSTFTSTSNNQFLIRAAGGVGIGLTNPASALHVNGIITATGFNGTGSLLSLGTTDNQPLELKVNRQRAIRIEPGNGDAINIIAGSKVNSVDSGIMGATIAGGGASNIYGYFSPNKIQADYSAIGGGANNLI